jgi:hypothetical protein
MTHAVRPTEVVKPTEVVETVEVVKPVEVVKQAGVVKPVRAGRPGGDEEVGAARELPRGVPGGKWSNPVVKPMVKPMAEPLVHNGPAGQGCVGLQRGVAGQTKVVERSKPPQPTWPNKRWNHRSNSCSAGQGRAPSGGCGAAALVNLVLKRSNEGSNEGSNEWSN